MASTGGGAPRPAPEARDWASLPGEILFDVFRRVGLCEVMMGAEFVCTAWRRVALHEPALWRRIGLDEWCTQGCHIDKENDMKKFIAVDRSAGQCEAFKGTLLAVDLLDLTKRNFVLMPHTVLVDFGIGMGKKSLPFRAPSLKTLDLTHNDEEDSIEELTGALNKFPLLEDLRLSITYMFFEDENLLGSVFKACPRLKKLVVMYASAFDLMCSEEDFSMEPIYGDITLMPELRSLELYDCDLSFKALHDILDNCPLLESLYVHGHFDKLEMDEDLRLKCDRVRNLTLPIRSAYYV
ncbi:hypothetical protein EJB05_09642, partial [Eragrostis curvula]